jgi:hydroxypyruvate reductase
VYYPGGAKNALARADSGTFLAEAGALINTGPTGTNVMDMVIALKTGK